ncbi:hypothetical protein [Leucobacter salsicius]|uniref:hypothetical protein n=1 Tax=Leucobacter salsicius TaxID=664638 RepID=UPI00038002D0|nr:hypothetical protein [Leucobacter salsicius]
MASNAEFERIVESVPELAKLDDGLTVTIEGPAGTVALTRVAYDQMVQDVMECARRDPMGWQQSMPWPSEGASDVTRYAVVREAYFGLAEYAFLHPRSPEVTGCLVAMHLMLVFCDEVMDSMSGGVR